MINLKIYKYKLINLIGNTMTKDTKKDVKITDNEINESILNSLKSNVGEIENKKTILHIFNSKYCLDKKNIENIPIGLFGDFYSQKKKQKLIQ